MKGYCELCGRYPSVLERAVGRGLAPHDDDPLLVVCPACRAGRSRSGATATARPRSPLGRAVVAIAVGALVLGTILVVPGLRPGTPAGAVLGEIGAAPGASTGAGAAEDPAASPPGTDRPTAAPARAASEVRLHHDEPSVRMWEGPYGEARLQVVLPIENRSDGWVGMSGVESRYRIVDAGGAEIASGVFTAAIPPRLAPGAAGYLVDTISATFVEPGGDLTAEVTVSAAPAGPPFAVDTLRVIDLGLAPPAGSAGMRVSGTVVNDGDSAIGWVVVGVIAVAHDGGPLGAVYDPSDIGRLEPGATRAFDTDYPGAPPVDPAAVERLVGIAFEADRLP